MGETSQPRMRTPSLMSSLQPSVKISQLPFMASIKSLFFCWEASSLCVTHSFCNRWYVIGVDARCSFLFYAGMHPVRDHVCEREKGSAHGQEPVLRWRELLHHPPGGGKGLLGSAKTNQYVLCPSAQLVLRPVPLSISCSFYGLHLLRRRILLNASDSVSFTACVLCLLSRPRSAAVQALQSSRLSARVDGQRTGLERWPHPQVPHGQRSVRHPWFCFRGNEYIRHVAITSVITDWRDSLYN